MLERFLTDNLTKHFGQFVQGLDSDQVRLSAWKGEIHLQNLQLRRHALDSLFKGRNQQAPVEIAYGRVGNLQVSIPWATIRSQLTWQSRGSRRQHRRKTSSGNVDTNKSSSPVSIVLTDVNLLITPRRMDDTTGAAAEETDHGESLDPNQEEGATSVDDDDDNGNARAQQIQDALDAELLKRVAQSSADTIRNEEVSKSSWIQDRLAELLENLSVTVRNIHVRYEDAGHAMGFQWNTAVSQALAGIPMQRATPIHRYRPSFCVGITLKEFSIKAMDPSSSRNDETVNEQKDESTNNSPTDGAPIRKIRVAAAEALAIYWDSDTPIMSEVAAQKRTLGAEYFEAAFCTLQSTDKTRGWSPKGGGFAPEHSFVLDPFSPCITVSLAQNVSTMETASSSLIQPSTLQGNLPPCRFALSRNLLEDLGYLRKSYAVWRQSNAGHISEATLRQLAALRPRKSPVQDPRGWWHYVTEAIIVMNRQEMGATSPVTTKGRATTKSGRVRSGWLGVARLLALRKKYLAAYEDLIQAASNQDRVKAHNRLVEVENDLVVPEVVAFRIHTYSWLRDRGVVKVTPVVVDDTRPKGMSRWGWSGPSPKSSSVTESDTKSPTFRVASDLDTLDAAEKTALDRMRSFHEMGQALDKEKANRATKETEEHEMDQQDLPYGLDDDRNPVTWKADVSCGEVSLQVDDRRVVHRHRDKPAPVIRLSCAFKQEQRIYRDGSWTYELGVGALKVKDCTHRRLKGNAPRSFPYLIGPKRGYDFGSNDVFSIDTKSFDQIIRLDISRSQHAFRSTALGSTTSSFVRVLPLEICYLTSPVEALSRILNTANIDFADDYQRLSSSIFDWRERQKNRLLAALSQQNKQILVNVDLRAPTILIPEGEEKSSPVLLVDLGHLAFSNDDKHTHVSTAADHWMLSLSEIQVQCSTVGDISRRSGTKASMYQNVIEPFSLNFAVSTRFHRLENDSLASVQDQILVVATLPRLVFDLNSSVVRLLRRLQTQWDQRKREMRSSLLLPSRVFGGLAGRQHGWSTSSRASQTPRGSRLFQFRFVAPLLNLKFENDVDGRDCIEVFGERKSTPILDLSLRGIEGEVQNERIASGLIRHSFQAKLKSIDAKDLYQPGGSQFCWLLSSISPDAMDNSHTFSSVTDLVSFRYTSSDHEGATGKEAESDHGSNRLSIRFHELFVEWNPDTIAAINYAVRASPDLAISKDASSDAEDDVFFDAEEDEFLEVGSIESEESDSPLISEISSRATSYQDLQLTEVGVPTPSRILPSSLMFSSSRQFLGGWGQFDTGSEVPTIKRTKRMEIQFELSKLRINFNKETRRRRVFTAEVDHTSVSFATRSGGGYKSKISLGNLTLADPQSDFDSTLYREFLGLKGDTIKSAGENSSLLEMTLIKNPRVRRFAAGEDWVYDEQSKALDEHVSIDLSQGVVRGCDLHLSATLSPMRFVYLQQLWFEIVDYMFEGVLGYEVWGNERPVVSALGDLMSEHAHAEAITYTNFEICMESPVILIPVTYCSTDFIRLETDSIVISNFYNYRPARLDGEESQLQWFNNCSVTMNRIILSSWCGHVLNGVDDTVNCEICLDWPTGPLRDRNKPKWRVSCAFDELRLSLPKEDFALLQHIIGSNISEPSRHLEEWNRLQNLPVEVREAFERDAFVAFGYDKKDVTPSTFDVTVSIPLLLFALRGTREGQIAVAQCRDVVWKYHKFGDLVSRQRVRCDINLIGRDGDSERMMLSSHDLWSSVGRNAQLPELVYKSTTTPLGDNHKELSIDDGCIHVGYKPWKRFADFFSQLPTPSFLSPSEVIQVGDRWYKFSEGSSGKDSTRAGPSLDWIELLGSASPDTTAPIQNRRDPVFKFDLRLGRPRIALKSEDSALMLAMGSIGLRHVGQLGLVERQVKLLGVELQTMTQNISTTKRSASLMSPLDVEIDIKRCNGSKPCRCSVHNTSVKMQKVSASVAFSDLVRVALVTLQLRRDINEVNSATKGIPTLPPQEQIHQASSTDVSSPGSPDTTTSVKCEGVIISLVDDSGRHFADSQELLLLTMSRISYLTASKTLLYNPGELEKSTILAIEDLRIRDSLQSDVSPFRNVLSVHAGETYESFLSTAEASSLKLMDSDVCRGIEFSQMVSTGSSRYMFGVHAVEMQYNPSMIVALQRFLGRLFKTIHRKTKQHREGLSERTLRMEPVSATKAKKSAIEAVLVLKKANVSLNKEHQGRCLLDVVLTDIHISAKQTDQVVLLSGMVGFFSATDANEYDVLRGIEQENRPIVKMRKDKDNFLEFEYKSFQKKLQVEDFDSSGLPTWVLNHSSEIDDYLELSVASVEVVYLSPRTSELIDYLSNGLPGKGMGATSRAAKGFVAERIQKKSFLEINVDAPLVLVPRSECDPVGLIFGGEVRARSWIEASDATRKLSLSVRKLYAGVYESRFQPHKPMVSNVDVSVSVTRDVSDNTSVRCNLSDLFARLSYSDYATLSFVMRENVARKIDRSKWDNVEVAWEHETISEVSSFLSESPRNPLISPSFSMDVVYSNDARHIRYGQARQRESTTRSCRLDVSLVLRDLSLVLRRDDPSGVQQFEAFDILLFRAQGFEASFSSVEDGSTASLSIHRTFVFDTGARGRQSLNSATGLPQVTDSSVYVLVEGYAPPKTNEKRNNDNTTSQLIFRVDKSTVLGAAEYRVSLVLNHLIVAALIPPLQDLVSFLKLEWPVATTPNETLSTALAEVSDDAVVQPPLLAESPVEEKHYHLQVVLHYPQFVFAAPDGSSHSRALVLRGLAILKGFKTSGRQHPSSDTLKVNADFQNVSSHIVPDSSELLCIAKRHYDLVTECLPAYAGVYHQDGRLSTAEKVDQLGVALLLPVTVGLEFEQTVSPDAEIGTKRSLGLNMEPLSVMLSSEDLLLIRSLVGRWASSKSSNKGTMDSSLRHFEVVFTSDRLGLGLRRESGDIVVDASHDNSNVCIGDILYSINGAVLAGTAILPLSGVVERLREEPRPLRLGFIRKKPDADIDFSMDSSQILPTKTLVTTSADLSFSEATITLIDEDVSLLRGKISGTRITFHREQSENLLQKLTLLSSLSIDYYNLRIWHWEPLLEPARVFASAEYTIPHLGPKSFALEAGDRDAVPLSINVTDAGASVLSRVREWAKLTDDPSIERVAFYDQAGEAANVALQFAKRQKHSGGKPFVFENKCGLSCAFAVQKKAEDPHLQRRQSLSLLGEYRGLQSYSDSDVYVVAPDSEYRFRVQRPKNTRRNDGQSLKPCLTVAFQSIVGNVLEPICDLQMTRPGESLVALSYKTNGEGGDGALSTVWLSWRVEVTDERTILTLGSAFRIASQLRTTPIEVGVESDDGSIKSLGLAPENNDFHLPVWLSLKSHFRLHVKPDGPYEFAPIYESTSAGGAGVEETHETKYIQCLSAREGSPVVWLASRTLCKGMEVVVTIDCCLTLLNLLPLPLQWEVSVVTDRYRQLVDGSSQRDEGPILVGKFAEVLGSQQGPFFLRLKSQEWSNWVPLYPSAQGKDSHFQSIALKDTFGVPLVVGLRTTRQTIGMQVTFFAETWFLNATTLNLSFGAPSQFVFPADNFHAAMSGFEEISTAEAALKEFSALFETGEGAKDLRKDRNREADENDICLLPFHSGTLVTEECYEYIEVESSVVKRRWWGTENPKTNKPNLTSVKEDGVDWRWVDSEWLLDNTNNNPDAWETASRLNDFSRSRDFVPSHKFRRRRWYRRRRCDPGLVTAFSQGISRSNRGLGKDRRPDEPSADLQFAVRVEGGRWAMTSRLPPQGVVYGAIRTASKPSGSQSDGKGDSTEVYELCYSLQPMEGEWGELSRLMIVSSRFMVRNDSSIFTFEVKQVGCPDSTCRVIPPEGNLPFHWSDLRLPALICVRPLIPNVGIACHKWSGGFDPLTIGVTPVRIREVVGMEASQFSTQAFSPQIKSLKVEAGIRPRSGGAGINISFKEEDESGQGCLYRIDNCTPFPVWFAQDGLLANPTSISGWHADGDMLRPSQQMPFALDVPFRQGKYSHRKAASIEELLRVRLSLAPLNSRMGIEATRVVSFASVGETVRLNPAKIPLLEKSTRAALMPLRVIGVVTNDGPTRVLNLVLMRKEDNIFASLREEMSPIPPHASKELGPSEIEITEAAENAAILVLESGSSIPTQEVAVKTAMDISSSRNISQDGASGNETQMTIKEPEKPSPDDLIISLRVAFGGLTLSLIDSAPSEIAVVTLKNVNAIASWNTKRKTDSTIYWTIAHVQVDNMVPNAPYPVAIVPLDHLKAADREGDTLQQDCPAPVLVIGVSLAPRHRSGVEVVKSVTIAPRNLAIRVDLAFLVRLQKFYLDLQRYFARDSDALNVGIAVPDLKRRIDEINLAARFGQNSQVVYFGGLTILPCNIQLSVAPARALTPVQASLEGAEATAIHRAVRKGDLKLGDDEALLGVKIGHRNDTPLAVVRGVFKSIVVDALLRLDGASLNFNGISLKNHVATGPKMATYVAAHYMDSLRKNVPALVGSLAALGNPVGLVRGLGDGVSDFVLEPVKGFQRSLQENDMSFLVDGVARGTLSLARHTVGGFANSAAALTETFSKNMTVLTLDRRYAQKRDRGEDLRAHQGDMNVAVGIGSGAQKLIHGFLEGVTGVVKAPIRGAEKRGLEGFGKGVLKGLLGLLVKPLVGISDGLTDVMIGVKGSVDGASGGQSGLVAQIRPRRPVYGRDRAIRQYSMADAAALALMQRTRLAGELYMSHLDMGDRLALLSVKRLLLMGPLGEELLVLKFKHIERAEMQGISLADGSPGWGIILVLNTPRRNGSEVEVINCREQWQATTLLSLIEEGTRVSEMTSVDSTSSVS